MTRQSDLDALLLHRVQLLAHEKNVEPRFIFLSNFSQTHVTALTGATIPT
jgi:hypothetical protein